MQHSEAEQRYRELEQRLIRGELTEDAFLFQVAQLRVTDEDGRRWMLSGRSGHWLVYDGREWVFAEPERAAAGPAGRRMAALPPSARPERPGVPRWLISGALSLLVVSCIAGVAVAAWVLFLRDLGGTPTPAGGPAVALVETWTPRPATATYTPTSSPPPSRTPTPTVTPIHTDTPAPAPTAAPTDTPIPPSPTSVPSPTATAVPGPTRALTGTPGPLQTYVVQKGDTLSEIAARFGVSLRALAAANGITDPALIRPGQVLVIPQPGVTPATPTRTATPTTKATALRTSTPTPTRSTSTPKPSPTATPRKTSTPKPPTLRGKIAYTIWNPLLDHGKYDLYVSKVDGTGRVLVGHGFRQPQFWIDGTVLVANGDRNEEYEHLNVLDAAGGVLRQVSQHSEDAFASWAPDGQQLVYSSLAYGDGRSLLGIVYDQNGRQWRWVPFGIIQVLGSYPYWMADGRIVYSGCNFWSGGSTCGLYTIGANGENPQGLTTSDSDTAPAAYQSKVAFMSHRDGNWEVYTINADGSGFKRLTNNAAEDGLPTWSPDGTSIAFVSTRSGVWAIWAMNSDGTGQRKLFDLGGEYGTGEYDWTHERISWAP